MLSAFAFLYCKWLVVTDTTVVSLVSENDNVCNNIMDADMTGIQYFSDSRKKTIASIVL